MPMDQSFNALLALRPEDELKPLDNFQRYRSLYATKMSDNVQPEHYRNANKMTKGAMFHRENTNSYTADKLEEKASLQIDTANQTQGSLRPPNEDRSILSKTGVEHWKTTYETAIKDPFSYSKANQPSWSRWDKAYSVDW
jgi:hypothetical protein